MKRTKLWEKTWFSWTWKIVTGLTIGATIASTWWMRLNFATKEEIKEMQNLVTKADFDRHKEIIWKKLGEQGARIQENEKDIEVLQERTKGRR